MGYSNYQTSNLNVLKELCDELEGFFEAYQMDKVWSKDKSKITIAFTAEKLKRGYTPRSQNMTQLLKLMNQGNVHGVVRIWMNVNAINIDHGDQFLKKDKWSKEAKERLAARLFKKMQDPNLFDAYENKKKNLEKITDDFPRY